MTNTTGNDGFYPYSVVRHGTLTGYDRHRERGQPVCAACRDCRSSYDQRYRKNRRIRERARHRALTRLSRRYTTEFAQLFELELVRARAEVDAELRALADAEVAS